MEICPCLEKKPLPGGSVAPDVRGWGGDSCGAADAGGEECGGRPQHKGSCVGQHTGHFTRLSAHPLKVRRRPSLLSSGKYQGSVYVPLRLEILVTGECLCSELHLCFAVTKIMEGSCLQLGGPEFPQAPDRVANCI